jgi:lipopolysaccharide export system protein LptA
VTTGTGITATYNAATGVLSLSGTATLANYQTVLDSVTYSSTSTNPTNTGANTSRTLSWQVNDGTLASNTVTSTVNVAVAATTPVLTGAGNIVTFTQGGAPVAASPGIAISDTESATLASARVSFGSGFFAGDVLTAVTTGTAITATYSTTTGLLTLTGTDTLAHYQQVLESVTYSSTSANPTDYGTDTSRTLDWRVNDGAHNSAIVTSTVKVVGVDQAPVLAGAGNTATYTQNGAAVTASGSLTVTDADNLDLASATVSISGGFFAGDVLSTVTTGTAITASYNAATGVLTLTGTDTLAHYRTVLHLVKFSSTSLNPTDYGTDLSRTLSWQVSDGTLASNTVTSNVTVVGVDQVPVIAGAGNTVSYTQGGAAVVASSGVTVSSADNLDLASARVWFGSGFFAGDVLAAVTTGTAITASYNAATGVLSLTGTDTLAHYQQVLDSVTYSSTSANPTDYGADLSRTLSWQVSDGTLASNTVTSNVTVVGVDQAPVLSGAGNTVTYTQGGAPVAASPAITASSVDNLDLASASVTISTGYFAGDVLAAVTTGTAITATYSTTTHRLTLTGSDTLAHYQQVLESVTYSSTSGNPTNYGADTSRTLSWLVNDGTLNSATVTSKVTVVGVDQAPVLGGAGNTVAFTQGGARVVASPAITASSVDNLDLASATVSITSGFFAGDTLAATTTGTGITATYNATTGVLTLSGSATVAHYQTVLRSVTYQSTSTNATNGGTDLSRTLTWVVNDGTLNSNSVTSTVTVAAAATPAVAAGPAVITPAAAATANVVTLTAAPAATTKTVTLTATPAATSAAAQVAQSKPQMLANTRLNMGSLSAAAGSNVVVPVNISSARGLQSMHLVVRYDARAMTPVAVEPSALTSGFSYKVGVVSPGELRIEATNPRPLKEGSGALFGLKFALAPTATGKFSIDFASATLNGNRLAVRDPNEGAIIVKAPPAAAPKAGPKPAINLKQSATNFELSNGKTHAWLDEFLKPSEGKSTKANSWSVVVKPRTLH